MPPFSLFRVFSVLFNNWALVRRLSVREIAARYRGSVLGLFWLLVTPILMITIYTFVFAVVFKARWSVEEASKLEFGLNLFLGLLLFNIVAEILNRSPTLILENVSYVKKVIFPLEIQAWVALLVALFNAMVGVLVLVVVQLCARGLPPLTAPLALALIIPLTLFCLGILWFFSALGVYLRDLRHACGILTSVLMFLSPLFYPLAAVPPQFRQFMALNPLSTILEQARQLVFKGELPDLWSFGAMTAFAWIFASLALWWFTITKRGFADVV